MPVDLSAASDDGLILILLRVPIKDLIKICPQVSPQWNRILSESYFWRKKMEYDGYVLEWPKLINLSIKSFQCIALKHCFGRNYIKDSWNLALQNRESLKLDPRWDTTRIGWPGENNIFISAWIEIPPLFRDGEPEIPPAFGNPIPACIAVPQLFTKRIAIKLSDEGLTDDIMDNFRPTIVVTEMVGNRRGCKSGYLMKCSLEVAIGRGQRSNFRMDIPSGNQRECRVESKNENGVCTTIKLRFQPSDAEGWHKLEHVFKDYPAGMRYLVLDCVGSGIDQNDEGQNGLKLANCSVKALVEKNVVA